jgi:hypothetical protein
MATIAELIQHLTEISQTAGMDNLIVRAYNADLKEFAPVTGFLIGDGFLDLQTDSEGDEDTEEDFPEENF